MTMALMLDSIVGLVIILMLFLIFLVVFIYCKPWRFIFPLHSRTIKVGELERPLVSDNLDAIPNQSNELPRDYDLEGACQQNDAHFHSSISHGLINSRIAQIDPSSVQGDSVALNVNYDISEDLLVGQTLRRPLFPHLLPEEKKHVRESLEDDKTQAYVSKDASDERSCLTLEVISGPSRGERYSIESSNSRKLPLTVGRVPPSDLLLKDSEVSGKHAMINWNSTNLRWELRDMGSLNGTILNLQQVNRSDSGGRVWGEPFQIANGDVISLGTTSKVVVNIKQGDFQIPVGVGLASDPMAMRRGGKKFPMEDVCCYQWPLSGVDQFGLFCICDGHGGAEAAKSAIRILSKMTATILSDSQRRERVLSTCNSSDVLRDAFSQTEASLNHQYEGCTATLLLVWIDDDDTLFAQCANVGDSACVLNVGGSQTKMTEDHRVTSSSERCRIEELGEPLRDGETRLCGLNLARMLGDKFLKEQDARFSSEPYISKVVQIARGSRAFAVMASDGLWDVMTVKKAVQLVLQVRDKYNKDEEENSAAKIANYLLNEARTLRTKDNTSVIFIDFDTLSFRTACKAES